MRLSFSLATLAACAALGACGGGNDETVNADNMATDNYAVPADTMAMNDMNDMNAMNDMNMTGNDGMMMNDTNSMNSSDTNTTSNSTY